MLVSTATLGNVMLIDDSKVDNFVNSKVLELSEKAENIQVYDDAYKALEYLDTTSVFPDVIFLDIYMPIMNGFDFLEDFTKLKKRGSTKIYLLSSAYDNLEIKKLKKYDWISGYIVKPLTHETIESLLQ